MTNEELKKIYNAKRYKVRINEAGERKVTEGFEKKTFEDLIQWFQESEFSKGCHYCGTTNERSLELFYLRPQATRGGKRGKRLELERRDPKLHYDHLENLVWCCYWCNNAKSNFFSEGEFIKIGEQIGLALRNIKD